MNTCGCCKKEFNSPGCWSIYKNEKMIVCKTCNNSLLRVSTPDVIAEIEALKHEKHLERKRLLKHNYYSKLSIEQKRLRKEKHDERMKTDYEYAENYRQKDAARKAKARERNLEEYNRKQREYYANGEGRLERITESRYKREPDRLVRSSLRLLSKGVLGIDECLERVGKAVALAEHLSTKTTRKRRT